MCYIKLCGLSRIEDIEYANELKPEYIGFVFWDKSKRFVSREKARELKNLLNKDIKAVGVFVDEECEIVGDLLNEGIIDLAQLHGKEDEDYIKKLRSLTKAPLIQAFKIKSEDDVNRANDSKADYVLLDSGMGGGRVFDWDLLKNIKRDYFLAGGLNPENVKEAVEKCRPYAVDVSSGIETDGVKDYSKMKTFVEKIRN